VRQWSDYNPLMTSDVGRSASSQSEGAECHPTAVIISEECPMLRGSGAYYSRRWGMGNGEWGMGEIGNRGDRE